MSSTQTSSLSVVLGPPTFGFEDQCAGSFWTWRYRDVDADGVPEIEIGPRADAEGNLRPAATFRWSEADQKYLGPSGSIADQFLQFRPEEGKTAFGEYTEAEEPEGKVHGLSLVVAQFGQRSLIACTPLIDTHSQYAVT